MNRSLVPLAVSGALFMGACGGGESPETAMPSNEVLEKHAQNANAMWEEGMGVFVDDLTSEVGAQVEYEDNCVYFEMPEGDVVVKNPATYFYEEGDSDIKFFVYADSDKQENSTLYNGPFLYEHPDLAEGGITNIEPFWMKSGGDYDDISVYGTETNGESTWFVGPEGEKVSETIIIPLDYPGQVKAEELNRATEQLCGMSIQMEEVPEDGDGMEMPEGQPA